VPVRQQALTVVAPIPKASQAGIGAKLSAVQTDVCNALGTVKSLHFARFVVLSGADLPSEAASRLAFESNYDGELAAHLADLARALAPFDALLAEAWAGYTPGSFAAFAQKQSLPPATYYLGHPGLSALQILNDQSLRDRLETLLDAEEAAGRVKGRTAISVREALLAGLGGGFVTGPVDRGLPKQPESEAEFDLVIAVVVVLALFVLPMSVYVEWRERHTEPPAELISEDDPKLDAIAASEDAFALNGLTHHVPLRPGRFRRIALRLVLWFLEQAASKAAYKGTLGGISSIHFARWVLLDDDTVLFFSNYDGSWESYLGDFVDKAHAYLSAVWSNTKWFPPTVAMIFGGASKEDTFKQWVRTFQVQNQIWFSAYAHTTVSNVLDNATLREGAAGRMTEEQARAWLALL
jgi:hypothetical protein